MSKLLSLLLCFAMVFSLLALPAQAAKADASSVDGTYTGTGTGRNGDITLSVTIADGKITQIENVSNKETPKYWAEAVKLFDSILAANGTDGVDAVSGATLSSNGIFEAVDDALAKASPQLSGSGTEADPYVISSAAQLQAFAALVDAGNTYAGQYVALGADIDLSGVDNWNPIGAEAKSDTCLDKLFSGTFDGRGHTVSGLKLRVADAASETNVGLFSTLGNTAVVKNLNLTDADISLTGVADSVQCRAGILAGDTVNAAAKDSGGRSHDSIGVRIDSCSATGSVNVTGQNGMVWAAGLVGRSQIGVCITNCWTDAALRAESLGGTKSAYAGGITGHTGNYAVLANCAAFGTAYASSPMSTNFGGQAGGIVGMSAAKQYNTYAVGDVTVGNGGTKHTWVGALAGEITSSGMSKDSSGSYTVYPEQGAFRIGNYFAGDAVLKVETYDGDTLKETMTVEPTVDRGFSSTLKTVDMAVTSVAMTKADMAAAAFADTLSGNIPEINAVLAAYGITGVALREWQLDGGRVLPTGDVWVSGEVDTGIFASGDGTQASPYLIRTADQLRAFAGSLNNKINYADKYVALDADIDVSDAAWKPIGGSDWAFAGTFDGRGHTISGLTVGSASTPLALDSDNLFIGLFGVLEKTAVVRDVALRNVAFYTSYEATAYVGGIAGYLNGSGESNVFTGAVVDGCSVSGVISHTSAKGNQFVGGIVGMQYKGAVINSASFADLSCTVLSGDLAEVGGLVGLNNRGLVANSYAVGNVYGSGSRENGNEGMAVVSALVACNAGTVVNCYGSGDTTTKEYSTYVGMASGWVTGIGKTYLCWYDLDSTMLIGKDTSTPQLVRPVESIGTKVSSGVNDEGDQYTGGLVDRMTGYDAAGYAAIAAALNANFAAFPADITVYGLPVDALRTWTYDADRKLVVPGADAASVTYVQPACEKVTKPELKLLDGVWYGRDADKTTVVKITVADGKVTETAVVSGESSGSAYDAALAKAEYKATYGDFSTYDAADPTKFAGGTGTQADPYRIATEAQLRYLAESINADVDWCGAYFLQTADIALSGEWLPIGWALNGEVNGKKTAIAAYPFRGNYDGGDHTISGLRIGSEDAPADQMASGLFGLTAGELSTNDLPTDQRMVTLKNIHLADIAIYVATRYETFTGGLAGSAQNGIYIDNCSVTGVMNVTTSESFARAGGLAASVLRGAVTNSWTDVNITAATDTNHVYAGGLYGMDNRATTVNCYTLGSVTGNSTNNNKVHIGGLVGQAGGVHINCYAAGDVVSHKTTTDVGALNGRSAGIAVDYNCYFNSEALQQQGDTVNVPAVAVGVNANDSAMLKNVSGKTKAELGSEAFAQLLNDNAARMADTVTEVDAYLETLQERGFVHKDYYTGNDLLTWRAQDGVVGFFAESGPELPFDDVAAGSWYYDDVAFVFGKGLMVGTGGGRFAPAIAATRGMVVRTLYSMENEPNVTGACPFADVASGSYCEDAITWAAANGIVSGYSAAAFGPNDGITREQLATMLYEYAKYKGYDVTKAADLSGFADQGGISAYAVKPMQWAVAQELIFGVGGNALAPKATATRAQLAAVLHRFCEAFA